MPENRLMTWRAVPDGSVLEIQVSGDDGSFQSTGVQIEKPGGVSTVSHDSLVAGAKEVLSSPKSYSTMVTVSFLGADPTTVTIQATVTKPDGTPFGAPRQPHVTSGQNGDQDTIMVVALTLQTQGDG